MQQASSSYHTISDTGRMGLPRGYHGVVSGVAERSPGWLSEDAKSSSAKIYVSDGLANAVFIYNAKSPTTPIGTITSGLSEPLGNFTDAKSNLYVTSLGNNSLLVFAKGKKTPSKTYTNGLSEPIGVVVGKDGTIYVSEFGPGQVVEYDKGATSPSRTITVSQAEGVALDSHNNLYVSYNDANTGQGNVQKFAPKSTTGTNLGITVQFAGDIKLDKKNDLLFEDQIAQAVNFYKPGATSPYGTISDSGKDTYKLALNSTETSLYIATAGPSVDIFQAKPSGNSLGSITSSLQDASGVSLTPAPPLDE